MRTVKVKLEADTQGFKEPVRSAKESVDGLKDKVEGLDHQLDKIPADAAKAAAAMKLLKGDVGEAETHFKALGDQAQGMSLLEKRIAGTRGEVHKLTQEFEKSGDLNVFKRLGKAQGDLSELNNLRKKLSGVVEQGLKDGVNTGGKEAASTFSQLFEGGIIDAFKNPYVAAAAGVLALAIGPLIGSAIGGSIIAAAAGGAVALGVAGAAQADPKRVGAAWDTEIARIKQHWIDASSSFVGPTINAIHMLGETALKMPLTATLAKASTFVEPLAKGVAGFADGIARGVNELVYKAGPIIEVLKQELPEVGRSIELSLSMIAGGNKGAADGLRDILHVLEAVIVGFGAAIRFTEDLYHGIKGVGDAIRSVTDQMVVSAAISNFFDPKPVNAYAVTLDGAAHGMDKYATEADKAKAATDDLKNEIKDVDDAFSNLGKSVQGDLVGKIVDQFLALDDATIAWHDSLNKLTTSIDKHGRSLDLNTDAGVRNEKAILAAVKANAELYQQNLLNKMSAEDAGKIYDQNSEQLRKAAINAGLNAQKVDDLIGKYKNIPEKVQTILATIGLTDALNHLAQILIDFRNLNDKEFKTKYTVTTEYVVKHTGTTGGKEGPSKYAQGGYRHAAVGMYLPPSDPGTVLAAEPQTGGEYLIPRQGIGMYRAWDLLQKAGSGYGLNVAPRGGGSMKFEHTFNLSSTVDTVMGSAFTKLFRDGYVQVTSRAIVN